MSSSDEITYTDETCDNCGTGIIKIEPEDTSGSPHDAAFICDPDAGGCGMVDRYE